MQSLQNQVNPEISIRFFNKDLEFIGEIDNFKSTVYVRRWETFGTFEIHLEEDRPELFVEGYYIMLNNDAYRSGIIQYYKNDSDGYEPKSQKDIVIKGYSLLYLLYWRITVPPATNNGYRIWNNKPIEDIMYDLVNENAVNPSDSKRKIPQLTMGTSQHRGGKLTFQTRLKYLTDDLYTLSRQSGLGVSIKLDAVSKRFVFEVLEGRDCTYGIENPRSYIFSKANNKVNKRTYTYSTMGAKNMAYIGGQGDGDDREIVTLHDELAGLERKEMFVDARDIPEGQTDNLLDRGNTKLEATKEVVSYEFDASTEDYGTLWDLGDTATFVDESGFIEDNRITEVREAYESSVLRIDPVFGHTEQTIVNNLHTNSVEMTNERVGISASFKYLYAENATIKNAIIEKADIKDLTAVTATVETLRAQTAEIQVLVADKASIGDLNAATARITELETDTADIRKLIADVAHIGDLTVITADITSLKADVADIDTAMIGKADIDLANIKNGCITTAMIGTGVIGTTQIADGSITDAKIVGLTANKITAGRLDAALIEVVNLNAANITVGTINGVQIAPGAIDLDKLSGTVSGMINGAVDTANNAQITADGKNKIYYQSTQPPTTGRKTGDTWFDTANGYKAYVWNGTSWSASPFGSSALSDAVNSSITTAGSNASTALANAAAAKTAADQAAKDAQTAQSNASAAKTAADQAAKDLETAEKNLASVTGRVDATEEEIAAAQEAVTTAQNKANAAAQAAASAQSTADTAKQNAAAAQTKADSAYSLADQAKKAAATAQTSADGKNTVFYQTAQPPTTGRKTGDTWFDTDDGNRIYRWDGSKWAAAQFGTNAIANAAITNALIADATIQSAKIANLDAAKITTGILSADRIAAGSVVFGKLDSSTQGTINTAKNNAQSALNQLSVNAQTKLNGVELFDQTYNGDTACKPFATGTYTIVPATEVTGGNANSGNLIKTVNAQYLYTDYIPVNVDNPFYWCMDAYNLSTNTGTLYIQVCFYDKNKVAVETNEAAINIIGGVSLTAANTWQKLEGWSSVPALTDVRKKAYYARIRYLPRYSGQTGTTYIRNVHWKQLGSNQVAQIDSIDSVLVAWCYNSDKTYINGGKIYTGSIAAAQIAANAIIAGKIAANAVTASTILAGAVTLDKLAANSVNASKIVAGSITAAQLAAATITGDKIKAGTVAAGNLAANSVTSDKIVADAITTAKIAAKAVTANEIAVGTITAAQIAAGAITATQLAAGAVTAAKIAAGQITADKIAAGAITADKFYGTAITSKNYVANSAGTKIDLSNGTIDAKNFKVSSAGDVSMTGTLTMRGAQTLKICNNSAVQIASLKYESVNFDGKMFESAVLHGNTNVDLSVGSPTTATNCQTAFKAGGNIVLSGGQRANGQLWSGISGTGGGVYVDPLHAGAPTFARGCLETYELPALSGLTKQGTCQIIKNHLGGMCLVNIVITTTVQAGVWKYSWTVPAQFRPVKEALLSGICPTFTCPIEISVQPDGIIKFKENVGTGSAWIVATGCYFTPVT